MRRISLALSAVVVTVALFGPTPRASAQLVRAYVEPDSFAVGERVTLVVVAEHVRGDTVSFPTFRPEAGQAGALHGDLIVFGARNRGRKLLGPGYSSPIADTIAYEVATFALDSAFVPQVSAEIAGANGRRRFTSDPFFVPVSSTVPHDATTMRDISPIAPFRRSIWPFFGALLAVAAAAYVVKRWLQRPRAAAPTFEPPLPHVPEESPIAEATRRLRVLEQTDLERTETLQPYYVELADTLRTYLERKLGVPALERTTAELDAALVPLVDDQRLPEDIPNEIRVILEQSDLAKFARYRYPIELSRSLAAETQVLLLRIEDRYRPSAPRPEPDPDGGSPDARDLTDNPETPGRAGEVTAADGPADNQGSAGAGATIIQTSD
jgi:hypothetical protein